MWAAKTHICTHGPDLYDFYRKAKNVSKLLQKCESSWAVLKSESHCIIGAISQEVEFSYREKLKEGKTLPTWRCWALLSFSISLSLISMLSNVALHPYSLGKQSRRRGMRGSAGREKGEVEKKRVNGRREDFRGWIQAPLAQRVSRREEFQLGRELPSTSLRSSRTQILYHTATCLPGSTASPPPLFVEPLFFSVSFPPFMLLCITFCIRYLCTRVFPMSCEWE